jgi:hypothetical protein
MAGLIPNGVLSAGLQPQVEALVRAADALLLEVFTGVCIMMVGRWEKGTCVEVDLAG